MSDILYAADLLDQYYTVFIPMKKPNGFALVILKGNELKKVAIRRVSHPKPIMALGNYVLKSSNFDLLFAFQTQTGKAWLFPFEDLPNYASVYLGRRYDCYLLENSPFVREIMRRGKKLSDLSPARERDEVKRKLEERAEIEIRSRQSDDAVKNLLRIED